MKLIAKYNRVTIPIIIVILLISSIGYYFILQRILIYQVDKDLRIEQKEIIQHIKETGQLPETSDYKDQQISFRLAKLTEFKDIYSTENYYNKKADETESFRRIDFLVKQGGKYFVASVKKSQQETQDILKLILAVTLAIIVVLLLILFISNRFLLTNLWKPFRNTLEQLRKFNFFSENKIVLQKTDIDEFKELDETVLFMTQKLSRDYEALKSFTENASHEIQTPLSIIKNKIELLSQSDNLDEVQINLLQSINQAASRLSRLNQSLLLLTKIENMQFANVDSINFSSLLTRYTDNFEELADAKGIIVAKNSAQDIYLNMNESLAGILISNIITNAIKHNYDNGEISIELNKNFLRVSNTGHEPLGETSQLFERFRKESSSHDSLGLGLSIVKTIAEIYGFSVYYTFECERHIVEIIFHNSKDPS